MPFQSNINVVASLSSQDKQALIREFTALRAELDDVRTKYAALVALLVAATALGAGYSTGTTLAAKQLTAT